MKIKYFRSQKRRGPRGDYVIAIRAEVSGQVIKKEYGIKKVRQRHWEIEDSVFSFDTLKDCVSFCENELFTDWCWICHTWPDGIVT